MLTGVDGTAGGAPHRLVITPDGMPVPDGNTPLSEFDPMEWEITPQPGGLTVIRHRSCLAPKEE